MCPYFLAIYFNYVQTTLPRKVSPLKKFIDWTVCLSIVEVIYYTYVKNYLPMLIFSSIKTVLFVVHAFCVHFFYFVTRFIKRNNLNFFLETT